MFGVATHSLVPSPLEQFVELGHEAQRSLRCAAELQDWAGWHLLAFALQPDARFLDGTQHGPCPLRSDMRLEGLSQPIKQRLSDFRSWEQFGRVLVVAVLKGIFDPERTYRWSVWRNVSAAIRSATRSLASTL